MNNFRLIETMRVSGSGEVYLLDRHLERLSKSARHFSFKCDLEKLRAQILEAIPHQRTPACLRLTLAEDGAVKVEAGPIPTGYAQRLTLSSARVNSNDVFLYHKTTNRTVFDQARCGCDENTDVILINERDEITETTIMNLAVLREGRWITPHVSSGLLPGVMRAELLAREEIVEGVIPVRELQDGERIRCFNALRGIFDVVLRKF